MKITITGSPAEIKKLLDAIGGSKEQLEKMETRIDKTNAKLSNVVSELANH